MEIQNGDDDIEALNKLEQIDGAYGIKTKDSITKIDEKEKICKVIEYNKNKLYCQRKRRK